MLKNPKFWIVKPCEECDYDFQSLIRRNQKFCSNKCSAVNKAKNPLVSEKRKKTNQIKYGGNSPYCSKKVQNKWKTVCLKKYGVDNPSKNPLVKSKISKGLKKAYKENGNEIHAKIQATWRKNYGDDITNIGQVKEIRKKVQETCLEKYGVTNQLLRPEMIERSKKSNLERLGVEYPTQCKEVMDKVKATTLKNYGVEQIMHHKEISSIVNKASREYWSHSENRDAQRERQLENLKRRQFGTVTKPEQIVMDLLDKNRIEYEFQFELNGFLFDFLIKNTKIIIEVDGDYWHCNPSKYSEPINEMQISNIEKDKVKTQLAINAGYDVFRFWESDLTIDSSIVLTSCKLLTIKD